MSGAVIARLLWSPQGAWIICVALLAGGGWAYMRGLQAGNKVCAATMARALDAAGTAYQAALDQQAAKAANYRRGVEIATKAVEDLRAQYATDIVDSDNGDWLRKYSGYIDKLRKSLPAHTD